MSGLPEGWEVTILEDVLSVKNGFAFKSGDYKDEGHFLIRIGNVQSGYISLEKPAYVGLDERTERFALSAGDILTSLTGNIGRVAKIDDCHLPAALNQRVAKLVPASALHEADYLYSFLSSDRFGAALASHGKGAAQQNVSPKTILGVKFPLPPLAEQRRIVEKLDQLSARTRAAKDHLAHVQTLATRAKQATLAAIFAELPAETERSIGSLAERITKGSSPKWQGFAYREEGVLFIRSQNVGWGHLLLDDKAYLPVEFNTKQKNSVICFGDVLLNIVGASIGRSAVADERISGANCNQAVAIIRLADANLVSSHFLNLWLGSGAAQSQILEGSVDVARANFSLSAIKSLSFPWPSTEEQAEIVSRIEVAFARIDRMVAVATRAADLLERLEAQLLAKAFQGELVPQDPADEPASALLARIREARAKAPKPKRTRKRVKA